MKSRMARSTRLFFCGENILRYMSRIEILVQPMAGPYMMDAILNNCVADERMNTCTCKPCTYSDNPPRLCFGQIPLMHTPMVLHHGGIQSTEGGQKSLSIAFSAVKF